MGTGTSGNLFLETLVYASGNFADLSVLRCAPDTRKSLLCDMTRVPRSRRLRPGLLIQRSRTKNVSLK